MGDWGFAAILFIGMVLIGLSSYLQYRFYMRTTERMRDAWAGREGHFLVSGRGRHPLRGVVVLLVIDSAAEEIVDAKMMRGATVFARFRPRPSLLGPLVSIEFREDDPTILRAVAEAAANYRSAAAASRRDAETAAGEQRPRRRKKAVPTDAE